MNDICTPQHIYCKECLESFFDSNNGKSECPQCQSVVFRNGMRPNYFALRLLSNLRILCPFAIQNCQDEKESELYQCEWIGCYSDVIDHLRHKCKYGTFINAESIQRIRQKHSDPHNMKKQKNYNHQTMIDLDTKIGTFAQLKSIAGIHKKKKRRKSSLI